MDAVKLPTWLVMRIGYLRRMPTEYRTPSDSGVLYLHGLLVANTELKPSAPPEPLIFDTILDEAKALTGSGGDRNDSYDHPRKNFRKIAGVWNVLLADKLKDGCSVSERDVALLMIGMKCVRDSHFAKRDNLVDIAGYARTAELLLEPETESK